jgi:hypothetical protein
MAKRSEAQFTAFYAIIASEPIETNFSYDVVLYLQLLGV